MDFKSFLTQYEKTKVLEHVNQVQDCAVVSVCIQTYNHEKYIEQCLQGILFQKTNFNFEILLSEDNSNDNTRNICIAYANKYPDKIKLFLHHRENNIKIGGAPTGRFVFLYNFFSANSKYLALCEGDDYWTDPLKLQKQVDFLEKNKEYSGIATNAEVIYDNTNKESHLFKENVEKTDFELDDLLKSRYFHTATFLFRSKCFKPDFPTNILSGDRTLFMLVACFGKIKLLEDVTAVYRKNEGGISQRVSSTQMMKDFNIANFIKKHKASFDLPKLQAFVAYTIFSYSTVIEKADFRKARLYLYYYSLFDNTRFAPLNKWWTIKENKKLIDNNKQKVTHD